MSSNKACVLAGGAYGTALAVAIASRFASVSVWQVNPIQATEIETHRENSFFLTGVELPDNVHFTSSFVEAVDDASFILSTIPTQPLRSFLTENASLVPLDVPVISCSKGVNQETGLFPHELWEKSLPKNPLSMLSGPSFARELAVGLLTAVTIYGRQEHAEIWVRLAASMKTDTFRIFVSFDLIGAAVMGASKNVLAILAGAVSGANARALVIARGLKDLRAIAKALGSDGSAADGMAGLGDVVLTCTNEESRNFSLGKLLGQGVSLEDATNKVGLAEGLFTLTALQTRVDQLGKSFPLLDATRKLTDNRSVTEALTVLIDNTIYE
jgi:glycerol-3-phosphate dehydrogenase